MNSERYCNLLKYYAIPFFRSNENRNRYYQQDGAPPHYSTAARAVLNEHLRARTRSMDRSEKTRWMATLRSPDLTVCDLFLWGSLRDCVCARLVTNIRIDSLDSRRTNNFHVWHLSEGLWYFCSSLFPLYWTGRRSIWVIVVSIVFVNDCNRFDIQTNCNFWKIISY